MSMLSKVTSGKVIKPRRVLAYGVGGIGKTTWASQAESPLIININDGADDIGTPSTPIIKDWQSFAEVCGELVNEDHDFKTVIIDTLDDLEALIFADVCANNTERPGVNEIEEIGYGKGYKFARAYWRKVLSAFEAMRQRGIMIIMIAHQEIVNIPNIETGDEFARYVPNIHNKSLPMITDWCDEVLYMTYKTIVSSKAGDFGKKNTFAIGDGERVIYTTARPYREAKNRLGLPDELPMPVDGGFDIYKQYIPTNQ